LFPGWTNKLSPEEVRLGSSSSLGEAPGPVGGLRVTHGFGTKAEANFRMSFGESESPFRRTPDRRNLTDSGKLECLSKNWSECSEKCKGHTDSQDGTLRSRCKGKVEHRERTRFMIGQHLGVVRRKSPKVSRNAHREKERSADTGKT